MRTLSGLDASFLYMESGGGVAMHVASLMRLVPPPGEILDLQRLRSKVAERLHLVPPFRRRLVELPLGLHHPVWADVGSVDLEAHVREVRVEPGPRAREHAVAEALAAPLDRRRPLWDMTLFSGLDAPYLLTRIHHAAIDGVAGAELTVNFFDLEPEPEPRPPAPPAGHEPEPSLARRVGLELGGLSEQPEVVREALRCSTELFEEVLGALSERGRRRPALPFEGPRTSVNRALSAERDVALVDADLAQVKAAARSAGAKVNDVLLASVAGALARYLAERGEHPSGRLVALVPRSVRAEDERGALGNRVSAMLVTLASDVEDRSARLAETAELAKVAKATDRAVGGFLALHWTELAPPVVARLLAGLIGTTRVMDWVRPPCNVAVSNVPGPPIPLYLAGARLDAIWPFGPLFHGLGLNVTLMSNVDDVHIGLLACPRAVGDLAHLAALLAEELSAYGAAATALG